MSTDKRNTFSLLFIIKKAKLLKNGEAPIYLRVTINKQIAEIGIKRSVPVEHWNQAKESCNSKGRKSLPGNSQSTDIANPQGTGNRWKAHNLRSYKGYISWTR